MRQHVPADVAVAVGVDQAASGLHRPVDAVRVDHAVRHRVLHGRGEGLQGLAGLPVEHAVGEVRHHLGARLDVGVPAPIAGGQHLEGHRVLEGARRDVDGHLARGRPLEVGVRDRDGRRLAWLQVDRCQDVGELLADGRIGHRLGHGLRDADSGQEQGHRRETQETHGHASLLPDGRGEGVPAEPNWLHCARVTHEGLERRMKSPTRCCARRTPVALEAADGLGRESSQRAHQRPAHASAGPKAGAGGGLAAMSPARGSGACSARSRALRPRPSRSTRRLQVHRSCPAGDGGLCPGPWMRPGQRRPTRRQDA